MRGHAITNLGTGKKPNHAVNAAQMNQAADAAQLNALQRLSMLDLLTMDGADELFETEAPGVITTLSLVWKKKAGWKAKWTEPTNVVKVFGYFVSFFNDAAGTVWMDPVTGQVVASEALAEIFVETNHFTTHLNADVLAAPFSATGVKARVTAQVKLKGQGKQRGPATSYGSLVLAGSDGGDDTGPASAVVSLALRWGAKKKGFKATWQIPTTNWKGKQNYFKVAYSDNAVANWMNPHDGSLAASEAAATIKVFDTHHTTHLERSELASQFAAGVKVKVTPVNFVDGVETDGASSTSAFVAPSGEDTGPASAVQNLTLRWSSKKGFKGTWDRPATNSLSIQGYKIVFMDNAGANFMNAETGALASPNTEAGGTAFRHDEHYTTHLARSALASQFAAGVKMKVTPVNIVLGIETDGTPATSSFVAPSNEDAAAPGAVQSLDFRWSAQKGFKLTWNPPTSDGLSVKGYWACYMNSAETKFMNRLTGVLSSPNTEADAEFFVEDDHHTPHLVYAQLGSDFTPGVKARVTPVNVLAGVETRGTPSTSSVVVPGQDSTGIAIGIVKLPGVERSGTSQAGHTATTFILDAGASAVDDYYNGMALAWTDAADPDDRSRLISDYVGATRACVVATWVNTPVGAKPFEVHRETTLAGKTGTGHDTTHVVLGSDASAVDDAYNNYTLMMPSADSADVLGDARIRLVLDYVGATKTALIAAVTSALGNSDGYMLWQGTVGYENSDQTGKISGVSFRVWGVARTSATIDTNLLEFINGTGKEWLAAQEWETEMRRKSTGKVKDRKNTKVAPKAKESFDAPGSYTPMFSTLVTTLYRLGGSDGRSIQSYHAKGNQSGGTENFDPDVNPPIAVDPFSSGNWILE